MMIDDNLNSADAKSNWHRPIPTIGDVTSAAEREAAPDGWAFEPQVIDGLDRVLAARRDIRRYRSAPVPPTLVEQILLAGHLGPSVGHSQPWRFIVIDDSKIRERAAVMADRERLSQAALLTSSRQAKLLDLQLEGIREAPIGIVVACDRRAPAAGVLGRNTFTDADLWSCACAIENMWLKARAHGLGMGWVTLFKPTELAELLGLPQRVETLGWLCLGWPDERPPSPGLERRSWSKRLPLSEVVLNNRWPSTGNQPAQPFSALAQIDAPDPQQVVSAHDEADRLLTPPGSLGALDLVLDRVTAGVGPNLDGATLVLVGADHPICDQQVSAFRSEVTREVMLASVAGSSLGAVTARSAGFATIVADAGVDGGLVPGAHDLRAPGKRGDLINQDGLSPDQLQHYLAAGRNIGAQAASQGMVCLGEVGIGNTTVAAALGCRLLAIDPVEMVGMGAGADSEMVERKQRVIQAALDRCANRDQDPLTTLAALGGPEFAVLAGVVLGAAEAKMPVMLDGLATSVAALIAARVEPAVQAWLVAGQCSRESGHRAVLTELGLEPLLNLRLRAGEGVGACYAAQMVLMGLKVRREMARTASIFER